MKNYNIITGAIIFLLFAGSIFIIVMFNLSTDPNDEFDYLKNYEDNEYLPVYVSEEKMARLYYNDYSYYIHNDISGAYALVDSRYKNKRFSSLDDFKNYIEQYKLATLETYSVDYTDDKVVFYIRLSGGLNIIFVTKGVMSYGVYLDEFTVDIE